MGRSVRTGILSTVAVLVVAVGAATYAFGASSTPKARFNPGPGEAQATPTESGRPSTTGEDGRSGSSPSPKPSPSPVGHTGDCPVGKYHAEVERLLAQLGDYGTVTVDGYQSPEDCAAIKKFQERFGIRPVAGKAGPATLDVANRLVNTDLNACDAGSGTTVCVDLTHQTMWVVRDGDVVLGPTPVRTGRAGLTTPAGHFTITEKKKHTVSSYYDAPLPYWQRFVADIGFHETPSYLYEGPGSHGCVNLLPSDAVALWDLTSVGTAVHTFGRKPGT